MSIIESIFYYPFLMRIFDKLLTDKEKLKLIVNKNIYNNRCKLRFHEELDIYSSPNNNYWCFNCLTNINIHQLAILPKFIKRLSFNDYSNWTKSIYKYIPDTVIDLYFGNKFNLPIHNCIPKSVKYLTLGKNFYSNFRRCYSFFGYSFNNKK